VTTDFDRACSVIKSLNITDTNRQMADYWLSCWQGDKPPSRSVFHSGLSKDIRAAILEAEIRPDRSILCIQTGTYFRLALGFDPETQDLMMLCPVVEREETFLHWWGVATGGISVSYRQFHSKEFNGLVQHIGLPFCDELPGDARFIVLHTDWRPVGTDTIQGNVSMNLRDGSHMKLMRYTASETAHLGLQAS